MKKFVTLLMTGLLMVMCTVNVFAESVLEAGLLDVGYLDVRTARETYTIFVSSNGKATDGVTEITFDSNVLTAKEENVVVSDGVDLYSVNVTDGSVKISYISENAIPGGTFITVQLDVNENYLYQTVSATVTCVANDANGNALRTGYNGEHYVPDTEEETTVSTEVTESTEKKPESSESNTEAVSSEATEAATEIATEAATEAPAEDTAAE